jgi:D-alanyl-D-alanine carboxypeptidase/D-alanyl-D-alanine-endopeptidase (penicillin-binding protein 4)
VSRTVSWLRRGTAAVCCLVLAALVGGGAPAPPADRPDARPVPSVRALPPPEPPQPPPPVLAAVGAAPAQTAAGVARALAGPLADRRLGGRVVATVLDAGTGQVLLDRGGRTPVVPASTAKLATAAALLAVSPPDRRLSTRLVAGARPGELVLVGGGDPTLSAAAPGSPTAYEGASRIAGLAAAARRAGVRRVTRVVVDGSLFSGPRLGPGWDPVDVTGGYVAPITALMVDGGRQGPGVRTRSAEPDLAAGRALAAALGAPAAPVVRGSAPAGARRLAEVRSVPVARLVEQMLLASDNVLAETLARHVALAERQPASFAGAVAAVRAVLARLGLPVAGGQLVDGSGLSTRNRLTPALLAALLRTVAAPDRPELHALVPGLPVSGYDGTLDDRFRSGPAALAAGQVRAKTGTLTGVSALAGLVRGADGRLLAFAVVADRVPPAGTLAAEAALDTVAATLARCGCR